MSGLAAKFGEFKTNMKSAMATNQDKVKARFAENPLEAEGE